MAFIHYRYTIAPEYDHADFRQALEEISHDKYNYSRTLKQDVTATVWLASIDSRSLVVKRYNTRSAWHAIRRSFRRSRAENCRRMTHVFQNADICVAANAAVIQEQLGPIRLRSWFICEYIEGHMLVDHFKNLDGTAEQNDNIGLIKAGVIDLFGKLRFRHLSHGDLKASNILLSRGSLCLIDLDAAHAHSCKAAFRRAHKKDRLRFLKNWKRSPYLHEAFETLVKASHTDNK